MKPELRRFGNTQSPVVVIDDFSGGVGEIVDLAEKLAPFRANKGNNYPGLRRIITEADGSANQYVEESCDRVAQFIAGAFDVDGFDLIEASFSMVTAAPAELSQPQRAPADRLSGKPDARRHHSVRQGLQRRSAPRPADCRHLRPRPLDEERFNA